MPEPSTELIKITKTNKTIMDNRIVGRDTYNDVLDDLIDKAIKYEQLESCMYNDDDNESVQV